MAYIGQSSISHQVIKAQSIGYAFKDREEIVTNTSTGTVSLSSTVQKAIVVHNASGTSTYTLPSASAGKTFTFIHKGDTPSSYALNEMRIQPNTSDEINFHNNLSINPGYLSFFKRGTQVTLIAIDAVTWEVLSFSVNENMKNLDKNDSQTDYKIVGKDAWVSKATTNNSGNSAGMAFNGYGYVVKGDLGTNVEQYNDSANTWTNKTAAPSPGTSFPSAYGLNNFGYVCGGRDTGVTTRADTDQYNDSTNTWTSKADMPNNILGMGTASLNGYMYVFDGTDAEGTGPFNATYKYNDNANSWSSVSNTSELKRFNVGFNTLGYIYNVGGQDDSNVYVATNEQYNDSANTWVLRASLPATRRAGASFSNNEYGYWVQGANSSGTTVDDVYQYDSILNSWSTKTSVGTVKLNPAGFAINGYGYSTQGSTSNTTHQYN